MCTGGRIRARYDAADIPGTHNSGSRDTILISGVVARTDYDGGGRTTASWAETSTGTVLSRTDYALNGAGAAVAVRSKALKSSATGQTDADFLFSYAATWYDAGWRPEVSGFNGDKNSLLAVSCG